MLRYLLVAMLLASSAAAAAEIPSHMRGKWCGVPDDTYVKGPCGDGSLDTDVEMTVTATGFKVNDTECKAIQVTPFDDYPWGRRATKNPWGPRYRFKFRCSDGKISEQEWWIEKDSYLLIDVKRRSSAEPSNPWGVAIENILVETVTRVTIYGSACAQIPDELREKVAKIVEDIKRQKAAHKLDAAYLQMVKEKDKMGADAWCKSAKPYIDDFLKIQPPEQEIVTRQNMLPPLKYDHPYAGKLEIERVRDFAELSKRCETPEGVNRIACAKVYGPNREYKTDHCTVWLMPDKAYRDLGLDPKEVLRHERGHCNGWGEDHAGGRPSSSLLDIDGNRFDEYCNSTERESKLICASYTLGVSDTLAVQRTLRPSNARACIPEEVQLDQLVAVALIYVKSFPAERHLRAAQLLMVAFADAWPCKRK